MIDRATQIRDALNAIRRASEADLVISRAAVSEIERLVEVINGLTGNLVRLEGESLVSRALGRYPDRPSGAPLSPIVSAARLHGAVARYEFVLRQAGFLGIAEGQSPRPEGQSPRS